MAEKPHEKIDMAPDPEEDDLDDLDDVLDQFQTKPTTTKPAAVPSNPTSTSAAPSRPFGDDAPKVIDPGEEELEKSLQAGMADLMSELDANPEMQQQFETMMKELIAAGAAPSDAEAGEHLKEAAKTVAPEAAASASTTKPASASRSKGAEDFNSTIRRTMERMQQSDTSASASATEAANSTSEEDLLAQMMRELQSGEGSGMDGNEADFNAMLLNMMTQLTNKEILYEPMKELNDKFPGWMERNKESVKGEDLKRYQEQQKLVGEIVGRFEKSGYSDENESDRDYIVERMQKMQAAGSPPPDLVGDMSSAQEVLGDMDAGCPTQ